MRLDEARCAQAKRDAVYSMATIIEEFSGLFGLEITKEDTPEIYSILQDVCASCDSIYSDAKVYFNRMRPYAYYNEGTIIPEKEEKHRYEGSYPSGHTVLGWTSALLLADINTSPKAMEGLLARGRVRTEPRHRRLPLAERCRCGQIGWLGALSDDSQP